MYTHLASPGKIGSLTIKNRMAMTAASASLSEPDGTMTEERRTNQQNPKRATAMRIIMNLLSPCNVCYLSS